MQWGVEALRFRFSAVYLRQNGQDNMYGSMSHTPHGMYQPLLPSSFNIAKGEAVSKLLFTLTELITSVTVSMHSQRCRSTLAVHCGCCGGRTSRRTFPQRGRPVGYTGSSFSATPAEAR